MARGQPRSPEKAVMVVAANADTLEALSGYFGNLGVTMLGTRKLPSLARASVTTAVVIFPDEFRGPEVLVCLRQLRTTGPRRVLVVVTSDVQRYMGASGDDHESLDLVVLPRPSFGWAILDSIKLALADARSPGEDSTT